MLLEARSRGRTRALPRSSDRAASRRRRARARSPPDSVPANETGRREQGPGRKLRVKTAVCRKNDVDKTRHLQGVLHGRI